MRRLILVIGLLIVVFSLLIAPVSAQQPLRPATDQFSDTTDPISLIGAYYNAISRGEYDRAYSYWIQAPDNQTAQQFAAGFADTLTARALVYLPISSDAGTGNIFASLPTMVAVQRRDGTQAYFAGCFIAHKTNVPQGNATEADPNWYLQQGTLKQQDVPDLSVLDTACQQTDPLNTATINQLDPVGLVQSYFASITTGGVQQGFGYWENPPGDVFSTLYGQSLGGATNFRLYVNPEVYSEGAAGSIYATVAALFRETGSDSVTRYAAGCYVARLSDVPVGNATQPDPNWHFYNLTTLTLSLDQSTAVTVTAQGCSL